MTTQITVRPLGERDAFLAAQEQRRSNETDYEVTVNIFGLPTERTVHEVDADAVRVTSADIGVLAAWLEVKGGTVAKCDTGFGVTVWTLDTVAGADEGYVGCRVLVSVPVPVSGFVPFEVTAAVQA